MQQMTDAERRTFLMCGTRTGGAATVRADGRPHVVPVWFLLDGDTMVFSTRHKSVKARNMRDPRALLCVDEETPPYAFVLVEGTVSLSTTPTPCAPGRPDRRPIHGCRSGVEAYGARNAARRAVSPPPPDEDHRT